MLTTVSIKSMYAQYYSVNIDTKTVAAMVGAFATETAAEALYNEQVKTILKHYSAAEVAAAGIFASKYLHQTSRSNMRHPFRNGLHSDQRKALQFRFRLPYPRGSNLPANW